MGYKITRYEEKSDALFICVNSLNNPVYIEHFFTEEERVDEQSRIVTIENLIAQLEVMDESYVEPEPFIVKVDEVQSLNISTKNITDIKSSKTSYIVKLESK
jgi:hypothetical protein